MRPFETLNLIYDGYCTFCIRVLKVFCAIDIMRAIRLYDANDPATLDVNFPTLRGADVANAMYAVTAGGETYRGFFAFRRLMWSNPLTWLLLPLFYFPGAAFFGTRIYAWVARHRRHFGCDSEVCSIPNRSR